MDSAIAAWQDWLHQERRAANHTVEAYGCDLFLFLNHVSQHLSHPVSLADLQVLEPEDFSKYCAYRSAQGLSASSIARCLSTLRNFFRFLNDRKLVSNPSINAVAAPKAPKPGVKALSDEQARKALEFITDLSDTPWIAKRDQALFALLYGSGLRLGEALALTRAQAPQGKRLVIAGKDKERVVAVLPSVPTVIAEYLRTCPYRLADDQPLFVGIRGKPLNPGVVQRQMRRLRRLLGLPDKMTPRAFRNCFAQRLCAEGSDLQTIQRLLGHAHLFSTQRSLDAPRR